MDPHSKLTEAQMEAFSQELIGHQEQLLSKKLFYKITKSQYIRKKYTEKFMSYMLAGRW